MALRNLVVNEKGFFAVREENEPTDESGDETLAETRLCDGACKRLLNVKHLKLYPCGHAICGSCYTEMTLRGIDEKGEQCMLGECRRHYERQRSRQGPSSARVYLHDAARRLRHDARAFRMPQASVHLQDETDLDSERRQSQEQAKQEDVALIGSDSADAEPPELVDETMDRKGVKTPGIPVACAECTCRFHGRRQISAKPEVTKKTRVFYERLPDERIRKTFEVRRRQKTRGVEDDGTAFVDVESVTRRFSSVQRRACGSCPTSQYDCGSTSTKFTS